MFVINSSVRFTLCGVGGTLVFSGFLFLTCIDQDDARHKFGNSGGIYALQLFMVKWVLKFKNNSY